MEKHIVMAQAIVRAQKGNNPSDLYNVMDKVGAAGELDNATTSWQQYRKLEADYYAATGAKPNTPATAPNQIGPYKIFQQGTLAIVKKNKHVDKDAIASATKWVGKTASSIGKTIAKIAPALGAALDAVALVIPGVDVIAAAATAVIIAEKIGSAVSTVKSVAGPVIAAASSALSGPAQVGFNAAMGAQAAGVTPAQISTLRSALPDDNAKHGFDVATSLSVGMATGPKPPPGGSPADRAGWAIVHGSTLHAPSVAAPVVTSMAGTTLENGAAAAAKVITAKKESWWHKLLVKIHLAKA